MNTQTVENENENLVPIYIKLIEQPGEKTARLIREIDEHISQTGLSHTIQHFSSIETINNVSTQIIYEIKLLLDDGGPQNLHTLDFLEYLFSKTDKLPSFTEPTLIK